MVPVVFYTAAGERVVIGEASVNIEKDTLQIEAKITEFDPAFTVEAAMSFSIPPKNPNGHPIGCRCAVCY
jgi:hypothetical protein